MYEHRNPGVIATDFDRNGTESVNVASGQNCLFAAIADRRNRLDIHDFNIPIN